MKTPEGSADIQVMPAVETADAELASAAARNPADTAASLWGTVVGEVAADTLHALKLWLE